MTAPSSVVFYRPPAVWRDLIRAYRLIVDGHMVGELRSDQWLRVVVSPGRHEVQAQIDWTGSKRLVVDVADGGEARFKVEPSGNALMLWQMFGTTTYLRLTLEETGPDPSEQVRASLGRSQLPQMPYTVRFQLLP